MANGHNGHDLHCVTTLRERQEATSTTQKRHLEPSDTTPTSSPISENFSCQLKTYILLKIVCFQKCILILSAPWWHGVCDFNQVVCRSNLNADWCSTRRWQSPNTWLPCHNATLQLNKWEFFQIISPPLYNQGHAISVIELRCTDITCLCTQSNAEPQVTIDSFMSYLLSMRAWTFLKDSLKICNFSTEWWGVLGHNSYHDNQFIELKSKWNGI